MFIFNIVLNNLCYLLATFFGVGLFPIFPGTFASFIAIIIWYYFLSFLSFSILLFFIIFSITVGIICCHNTSRNMGVHDHNCIILDEFIGMWLSLVFLSVDRNDYYLILLIFFIFRFFDIVKPWPIILCHSKIKGGLGIILDDILSGFMTVIVVLVILNITYYIKYFW